MQHAPLAAVTRGGALESLHYGALAVAAADGALLASVGDPDQIVFPRSALKPFQALLLVESGAHTALGLNARHLALACASHRAEPQQMDILQDWLQRLGHGDEALACGPDWPEGRDDRDARVRAGAGPSRLQHNCSGKHLGMLGWCGHAGCSAAGYNLPTHPAQQALAAIFADALGGALAPEDFALDGCNLPTPRLALRRFAVALARFAACRSSVPARAGAMETLLDAMRRRSDLVSGVGQATQHVCEATGGRVLAKLGAEGVLAAWLPQDGLGVMIKTADGAGRARFAVLIEVLDQLGVLAAGAATALAPLHRPALKNSVGAAVGAIEPCFRLDVRTRLSR